MKWMRLASVAAVLMTACASAKPPDLERDVDRILHKNRGKDIAVAFYDLRDGRTLLRKERTAFHAASMMKVPVMLGIFEMITRGALDPDQPVLVKNEFTSLYDGSKYTLKPGDDSDNEMYDYVGRKVSLRILVRHMIVRSSNLATNNVIELVGAKNVMRLMKQIGANDIQVLRGVEDQKAFDHGMNNTTTAYDLMLIFRALGEHKIISTAASETAIAVLADQEFNAGIPAGLPKGTRVAHKTGDITRVAHDGGLVFRPDGSNYVLVVLTRGFKNRAAADKVIAEVSRAVWRATAVK